MNQRLRVEAHGRAIGELSRQGDAYTFEYDDDWRHDPSSFPLSLSLSLRRARHEGPHVRNFVRGLLPDNADVRRQWGRRFHVDQDNDFGLLRHVGGDVAGAIAFVDEERGAEPKQAARPLTEGEVAEFIRRGRRESAVWGVPDTPGRFSLAGQQAKMAVASRAGGWWEPGAGVPSTHILKPGLVSFEHSAINEFLSMRLAAAADLRTAAVSLERFDELVVLAVERFDRVRDGAGELRSVHQEDLCQSLGLAPERRYESDGGPGVAAIADHLSSHLSALDALAAKRTYADALIFNWLTRGTDAHAKNYSIQFAGTGWRLSPLYDLGVGAPYPSQIPPRSGQTRMAQAIGREARFGWVRERHWGTAARELGRAPRDLLARIEALADALLGATDGVAALAADEEPDFAERWGASVRACIAETRDELRA